MNEMDKAAKAVKERLESIFGQDDPEEACPVERIDARTSARRIADIAAMILQEAKGGGEGGQT